jgi:hypothetical protein
MSRLPKGNIMIANWLNFINLFMKSLLNELAFQTLLV